LDDAEVIDVDAECSVPARELVEKFLEFLRPALEEFGEWDEVYAIAHEIIQQGNGAAWQREVYKHSGSLKDVVDFVVRETAKGTTAV
jgi:carboxylate-amine ligase